MTIATKCNFVWTVKNRKNPLNWLKRYRDTDRDIGLQSNFDTITKWNIDQFEDEQGVELWIYNDDRILRRPKIESDKRVFLFNLIEKQI